MNIRFTERKVTVSDDLKAYATKKVEKLDRFFDRDSIAYITFVMERNTHTAEIMVNQMGMLFRAQQSSGDMYASIDAAVAGIERQILKNKTKLEKRLRQGAFERVPVTEDVAQEDEFDLVRVKPVDVKPMTVDDAILQMNMLNHAFFFFCNTEEKNKYCVVYKRKNGGYGMLVS